MKESEKIKELEKRIEELERRPVITLPYPVYTVPHMQTAALHYHGQMPCNVNPCVWG